MIAAGPFTIPPKQKQNDGAAIRAAEIALASAALAPPLADRRTR
jgi:hypothetical protein